MSFFFFFLWVSMKNGLLHNRWWANVDFIIDLCSGCYSALSDLLTSPFPFFALPSLSLWLLARNALCNSSSVNTVLCNRVLVNWSPSSTLPLTKDWQVEECESPACLPLVGTTVSCSPVGSDWRVVPGLHFSLILPSSLSHFSCSLLGLPWEHLLNKPHVQESWPQGLLLGNCFLGQMEGGVYHVCATANNFKIPLRHSLLLG